MSGSIHPSSNHPALPGRRNRKARPSAAGIRRIREMKRLAGIASALTLAVAGTRVFADNNPPSTNAAIQASGGNGANSSSLLPKGEQADLGDIEPESEAGILSYFHGEFDLNAQYISNAPLYHSHDKGDFLIAPALEQDFTAPLTRNFTLDLGARAEDFTYASHQTLGFWGFSGNADLEYTYKPAWPCIYAGMAPYYYFTYANGTRLTSAIGPVAGINQSLSINRGKTLFFWGYEFGDYFSAPGVDTRQSQTVTLSVTQQLRRDFYGQLYYQYQFSDYNVFGRDESRDVVGLSVIHQFNPHVFASLFVNYVDNASNNSLAKYTTAELGSELRLAILRKKADRPARG